MSLDQWMRLLSLLVSLIQVIIWPLILITILIYLRAPLKKFIGEIIEVTLKAGPLETTARKQQAIEVAASLGAASAEAADDDRDEDNDTREVVTLVNQLLTPQAAKNLEGTRTLWVDDYPSNNTYARNALEALGVRFTIAVSTEDALKQLKKRNYDLIISDMGRGLDQRAGYKLLEKVKELGISAPYVIYAAGGNKPENKAEALLKGAFASIGGPTRLFETVIQALVFKGKQSTEPSKSKQQAIK